LLPSQKGGSGKITLTASLAVAAEQAKDGQVVIIDTDLQSTLTTWWNARKAETPQLISVSISELPKKIEALKESKFSYCFIDTPPSLSKQNKPVIKLADLVLIPIRPSPNDIWSLGATLTLVKESNVPFVFILNQAKSNARITLQSLTALSEHGTVLRTIIHDQVDYAATMTDGQVALEINPSGASANETKELWRDVKSKVSRFDILPALKSEDSRYRRAMSRTGQDI